MHLLTFISTFLTFHHNIMKNNNARPLIIFIYRSALLLENYQPWLGLKVHSKVDASIGEVCSLTTYRSVQATRVHVKSTHEIFNALHFTGIQVLELVLENFVYPWYRYGTISYSLLCICSWKVTFFPHV